MSYNHDIRKGNLANWIKTKKPVVKDGVKFGFQNKNNKWKLVPLHESAK